MPLELYSTEGLEHTKAQRLQEFIRRLGALPPGASFEEARKQLEEALNAVES